MDNLIIIMAGASNYRIPETLGVSMAMILTGELFNIVTVLTDKILKLFVVLECV